MRLIGLTAFSRPVSFLRGSPSWDIQFIYSQSGSSLDSRMSSMCGKLGALSAIWRHALGH
jgi:hypothetical protein